MRSKVAKFLPVETISFFDKNFTHHEVPDVKEQKFHHLIEKFFGVFIIPWKQKIQVHIHYQLTLRRMIYRNYADCSTYQMLIHFCLLLPKKIFLQEVENFSPRVMYF